MGKLARGFAVVVVASACSSMSTQSSDVNGDGGVVDDGGGPSGDGGVGPHWVAARPGEYFFDIRALGGELWGLGGIYGTNTRYVQHRATNGTWTDTSYTLPQPLMHILPLAADDLYAIGYDTATVYHSSGDAWTVLFPPDVFSFNFLTGTGDTAYLGSQLTSKSWGIVRASTQGAPFTPFISVAGQCRSFFGGFVGNGVGVFSNAVFDCGSQSQLGTELWLSTGGRYQASTNPYETSVWWAASPSDIYAGWTASVAHLRGTTWTEEPLPIDSTTDYVVALAGTSAQDVWAVTDHAWICHSSGGAWSCDRPVSSTTEYPDPTRGVTVAVPSPGDAWVVIDDYLYHRQ